MTVAIRPCFHCDAETNHAWRPGRGQFECLACHEFAWPAQAPVDDPDLAAGTEPMLIPVEDRGAQEAGKARMMGMWHAAVRAFTETVEAEQRRLAEARTAPIDPGRALPPVLRKEDKS